MALCPSAAPVGPFEIRQQDCLEFLASLPDESVDLIVTDPAYSGMNRHLSLGRGRIVGRYRDAGREGGRWFAEFHDDPETFRWFLAECGRVLRPDRHIYVMFDSFSLLTLGPLLRSTFSVKNVLVWDKVAIGMGHHFRRRHELIVFASKGRRPLRGRHHPDVIVARRLTRAAYPTQKPVAVFEAMVRPSVDPGFLVCDPFVGAGTAPLAALRAGCRFVGADVSARAVELSLQRCREYLATGRDVLESDPA